MGNSKLIAEDWKECGISKGDMVLLHSSLSATFKYYSNKGINLSIDEIFESFLYAIGEKGTLLLPLFNFNFCEGETFDFYNTKSQMGKLTEYGRKFEGCIRTGHPVYSFAAIGFHAQKFNDVDNYSGYGVDSPFAIIKENNGKIAVLNLPDQHSMTFYHHVEEMENVDYRYHKKFRADYINKKNEKLQKEYCIFVRDIDRGVETFVNPMGELLWDNKYYNGCKYNEGCGLRTIESNVLYEQTSKVIRNNPEGLLMRFKGKKYE